MKRTVARRMCCGVADRMMSGGVVSRKFEDENSRNCSLFFTWAGSGGINEKVPEGVIQTDTKVLLARRNGYHSTSFSLLTVAKRLSTMPTGKRSKVMRDTFFFAIVGLQQQNHPLSLHERLLSPLLHSSKLRGGETGAWGIPLRGRSVRS